MSKIIAWLFVILLLVFPVASQAAPCWMGQKAGLMPCHQQAAPKEKCHHLTVADCAGQQMSGQDAIPQLAKAQALAVEYTILPQVITLSAVSRVVITMSHAPPSNTTKPVNILLTTQRYLI